MTELQLTSTDDLIKELTSRFDTCIFSANTRLNASNAYFIGRTWKGDPMVCLGLLSMLESTITAKIKDTMTDNGTLI